jgi:Fe-S cluster biogenesis protein NfuA
MLVDDRELTERAAQIGSLLERIESLPDPALRATAAEVLQGLLVLYGEGLARMLAIVRQRDDPAAGAALLDAFAADELIAHLLLLHDLHPVDVETRVARALAEVRPYLQSHGGNVELLGVDDGVARLRLQGSCHGCPSSTVTLKSAIEEAIWKAAPDLDGINAEGVAEPPSISIPSIPTGFIPASTLTRRTSKQSAVSKGAIAEGSADICDTRLAASVASQRVERC